MALQQCPYGHTIKTSEDRVQGMCRACRRERDRKRLSDQRRAAQIVSAMEELGLRVVTPAGTFGLRDWLEQLVPA